MAVYVGVQLQQSHQLHLSLSECLGCWGWNKCCSASSCHCYCCWWTDLFTSRQHETGLFNRDKKNVMCAFFPNPHVSIVDWAAQCNGKDEKRYQSLQLRLFYGHWKRPNCLWQHVHHVYLPPISHYWCRYRRCLHCNICLMYITLIFLLFFRWSR